MRLLVIDLGVDVNIPDTLGTTAVWLGCMRADPGIMQCLIWGRRPDARVQVHALGKLETPVEVAWRYNRTDLTAAVRGAGHRDSVGKAPSRHPMGRVH